MGLTNPKWLLAIFMLFIILTLVSGLLEGTYLGQDEVSTLRSLINPPIFSPREMPGWFKLAWSVFWFDYSFFHGSWNIFRYALFWPISAAVIISFAAILFQAAVVALQALIPRLPFR